ncbi:hypothetical protein BGX27_001531 [Mortierella sp. AM989]|nr:hypothetical protein BGX27_001531 [Mortierella sp. AM989]
MPKQLQVSVKESKIRQIQLELDASSNSQSQTGSSESGSPKSLIIPPRNESRSDAHIKIDVRSNIEVMAVTGANINMRVESNPNVKTDTDESQDYAYMPPPRSIPEKVLIHGLPKYFPEDNIGRNAKRNEMYARIRLKALREHQKVLVQLLSDLLGMDNMYRRNQSQNQTSRDQPHSVSEQGEQRQCGNRNQGSDTHTSSECFNKLSTCGGCRQALRLQKRELAVRGYQKAIIDLWHIDQNMCYWLSRYIQTARRVAQSIEFMFAIPVMCGAAEGITDDGSMQALSKEHVAIKVTDRESRHSLERMSILMSDHSVIAGSNDNFTSSTPSIIDEDAETLFPPPPLPSSTSHPTVSVLPIRGHSSYLHHQERQRQDEKDIQTRPEHASNRIRAYFQDLDCLEASIFVGFHMQSHQKSNESLNQFNKESNRSRIVIQRFNIAKEAYEHQILVKPWKMRSHGK